eukprot:5398499-Amphidinium_carterae.6
MKRSDAVLPQGQALEPQMIGPIESLPISPPPVEKLSEAIMPEKLLFHLFHCQSNRIGSSELSPLQNEGGGHPCAGDLCRCMKRR